MGGRAGVERMEAEELRGDLRVVKKRVVEQRECEASQRWPHASSLLLLIESHDHCCDGG